MFCSNCGKQLGDNDAFCPSCGTSVKKEEAAKSEKTETKPIITAIPTLDTIVNWKEIKDYVYKVAFLALVIGVFVLSRKAMFGLSRSGLFGLSQYTYLTISELVEYIKYAADLTGESAIGTTILYWIFRAGILAYFVAAGITFLRKEEDAIGCTVIGFICNLVFLGHIFFKIIIMIEDLDFFGLKLQDVILDSLWWYLAINIVVLVYAIRVFGNAGLARRYSQKTYGYKKTYWQCPRCGKNNRDDVYVCDCGYKYNIN